MARVRQGSPSPVPGEKLSPWWFLGDRRSITGGYLAFPGFLAFPGNWKSEKDAKLAQKLDQLQPFFTAVFLQECVGQLAYFWPT